MIRVTAKKLLITSLAALVSVAACVGCRGQATAFSLGYLLQSLFGPAQTTCYVNGVKSNTKDGRWLPVEIFRTAIDIELGKSGGGH